MGRPAAELTEPELTEAGVRREAWRLIHEMFFSDEGHARVHNACESVGLTPGLMKALLSVEPGEATPMKSFAHQWRCDASYVTSLIDGLEERGIVERRGHPTDRRSKTVALTPAGARIRAKLLDRLHEPPASFAALSPEEGLILRDLLRKVTDAAVAPAI